MSTPIDSIPPLGSPIPAGSYPRPEHVGMNVSDPSAIVEWYCAYLKMKVVRHFPTPANTFFIVDAAGDMLLEFYKNNSAPILDFSSLHPLSLHIALMTSDIRSMGDILKTAGAVIIEDIAVTPNGDHTLMMRDPWGLALQLLEPRHSMLTLKEKRMEHLAYNMPDPPSLNQWYCRHLQMKVLRSGPPPDCVSFLADAGSHFLLEVYYHHAVPVLEWSTIHPLSVHLAFSVEDVLGMRDLLRRAGAIISEDYRKIDSGDQLLMLRDPWGMPIQFVKRAQTMH